MSWAWLPGLLEKQGPPPEAINHAVGKPKQAKPHGGKAGWGAAVSVGGSSGPIPPALATVVWHAHFPGASSLLPWTLPSLALAQGRQTEPGQPPQDLGGLPEADEAIYTSGHSPPSSAFLKVSTDVRTGNVSYDAMVSFQLVASKNIITRVSCFYYRSTLLANKISSALKI